MKTILALMFLTASTPAMAMHYFACIAKNEVTKVAFVTETLIESDQDRLVWCYAFGKRHADMANSGSDFHVEAPEWETREIGEAGFAAFLGTWIALKRTNGWEVRLLKE
jgi:hypothetical protein